jgi:tetratricopeptide (TPR) repeat protein
MTQTASPALQGMFDEGLSHHQAGRLADAERLYRQVLQVESGHAGALHLLGVIALQCGRHDIAIDLIAKAIVRDGQTPVFHSNLGLAYQGQGAFSPAAISLTRAVALQPDYADAFSNLGNVFQDQGKPELAVVSYGRALALRPTLAAAHYNLANALRAQGDLAAAATSYRQALAMQPDYAEAHGNLAKIRRDQGAAAEALGHGRAALVSQPAYAEAHYNLGLVYQDQGRLVLAIAAYRRALAVKPDLAVAHRNLANVLLVSGRFAEGWTAYEWRWNPRQDRDFGVPRWGGEALNGRTILLHAEQGLGDTIQFCRYAALVAARGGRVVLEVQPGLVKLLQGLAGVDRVIAYRDRLPPIDVHSPLLSLPKAFGTTVATIPAAIPYLIADADRTAAWRHTLPSADLRVGIAWQGSPAYANDGNRSIPLAHFAPLARVAGVRLFSLQKVHGLAQLDHLPAGITVETLGPSFDNGPDAFLDSAAVIMNLDLLVTVDSALVHLAGALGRPVWLPLAAHPHWVWLLERDDSPWYPNTRLFRQRVPGDWQDVFARMAQELATKRAG